MSRKGLRRGQAHRRLVERVVAIRHASGDPWAWMTVEIARLYDVPVGLILTRRDLALR